MTRKRQTDFQLQTTRNYLCNVFRVTIFHRIFLDSIKQHVLCKRYW